MNKRWWHYSVGILGLCIVLSAVIALEQVPWAPTFNPATGVTTGAVLTESMLDTLFFNTKNLTDIMHSDGAGNLNMTGNRITNVSAPIGNSDVATKAYVDAASSAWGDCVGGRVNWQNGFDWCCPGGRILVQHSAAVNALGDGNWQSVYQTWRTSASCGRGCGGALCANPVQVSYLCCS